MDNDNALKSIQHNTSPGDSPEPEKNNEPEIREPEEREDSEPEEVSEEPEEEKEPEPEKEPEEPKILEVRELPSEPLSTEPKAKKKHGFRNFLIFLLIILLLLGGLFYYDSINGLSLYRNVKQVVESVFPSLKDDEKTPAPISWDSYLTQPEEALTDADEIAELEKLVLAEFGTTATFKSDVLISYKKLNSEDTYLAYIKSLSVQKNDYTFYFAYVVEPETTLPEDFVFTEDNWQSFPYYRYSFIEDDLTGIVFDDKIEWQTPKELEEFRSKLLEIETKEQPSTENDIKSEN